MIANDIQEPARQALRRNLDQLQAQMLPASSESDVSAGQPGADRIMHSISGADGFAEAKRMLLHASPTERTLIFVDPPMEHADEFSAMVSVIEDITASPRVHNGTVHALIWLAVEPARSADLVAIKSAVAGRTLSPEHDLSAGQTAGPSSSSQGTPGACAALWMQCCRAAPDDTSFKVRTYAPSNTSPALMVQRLSSYRVLPSGCLKGL
jgi:Ribosomal RNA large subunit methyltransferase D, RlmJ